MLAHCGFVKLVADDLISYFLHSTLPSLEVLPSIPFLLLHTAFSDSNSFLIN